MPYNDHKRHVSRVLHAKQKTYYLDLFNDMSAESPRNCMQKPTSWLFRKEALPLPDERDPMTLAERFNAE